MMPIVTCEEKQMKTKLPAALAVAVACAVPTPTVIANARPHADAVQSSTKTVGDLTGEEIFKAFYFGSGDRDGSPFKGAPG